MEKGYEKNNHGRLFDTYDVQKAEDDYWSYCRHYDTGERPVHDIVNRVYIKCTGQGADSRCGKIRKNSEGAHKDGKTLADGLQDHNIGAAVEGADSAALLIGGLKEPHQ